jgi:hypothetical protein
MGVIGGITVNNHENAIRKCKIWVIHGGNYEEYRLLGMKTQFVPHREQITSLQSPVD